MDTLLSLKVFAAVVEHKSFASVAERLGLSPTMTSKHVKHIEARVGARLLNRNSRNVSLTEAGERYLARDVILDLDLSGQNINLVEEGVDLALRVAMTLDDGLIARTLTEVEFPLLASPAFLDKVGRPDTIDDLSNSPFLIYSQMGTGSRIRYGQGPDALDIKFTPVLKTGNETLIHLAAREGMGFAFLPHWLAKDDLAEGLLEPVLPEAAWPKVPLYAIYPDRSYLPAKVRSFLDFLSGPNGLGKL